MTIGVPFKKQLFIHDRSGALDRAAAGSIPFEPA